MIYRWDDAHNRMFVWCEDTQELLNAIISVEIKDEYAEVTPEIGDVLLYRECQVKESNLVVILSLSKRFK